MDRKYRLLLKNLKVHSGAPESKIQQLQNNYSIILPNDYITFLKIADGAVGQIRNTFIEIWSIKEVIFANEANNVAINSPGLLLFGSVGGDEAFGFDLRTIPYKVVQIPFIGLSWNYAIESAPSFEVFLENIK